MSAAHLRATIYLIDRSLAGLPPGRDLLTKEEFANVMLDLRNAVQGAYIVELLGLDSPPQRLPRRLRRDAL